MSKHKCGACGKDPAAGYAKIGATRYCHGDYDACPTCYERSQRDYLPGGIKILPDAAYSDTSAAVAAPEEVPG